jgi:hypothetical protein
VAGHVAPADLLEDVSLPLLVGRRRIGLGDVQRDLAGAERLEHDRCKGGEPQPSLDKAHGEAEPPGDALDVAPCSMSCWKARHSSAGFMASRWKFSASPPPAQRPGRRRQRDSRPHGRRQLALLGKTGERAEAAAARFDREAALRLPCGGDDEVLQQPRASMSALS